MWENIASPHQSFFFSALAAHPQVDLEVRYFEKFHDERIDLGWQDQQELPENEKYVEPDLRQALRTVPEWEKRIHIIPGNSYPFTRALIDHLSAIGVPWIHWSERSGIFIAQKLGFRMKLFQWIYPPLSRLQKASYAKTINRHALGAFGQGELALRDFANWGVETQKLAPLFYTIGPMPEGLSTPEDLKPFEDSHKIIYAGSLTRRKGVEYLIRAFSKLETPEKWLLVIVGDGPLRADLEKLVEELGLSEHVRFLGAKPISQVPHYIHASDLFVLPTLFDGWGAVLNEAAALGRAIVSTDQCGAAYHLIEPGVNGYRVPAGNADALADALKRYVEEPARLPRHGEGSRRLYEENFTPQKNVERFLRQLDIWTGANR